MLTFLYATVASNSQNAISIRGPIPVHVEAGLADWLSLILSFLLVAGTLALAVVTFRLVTQSKKDNFDTIDAMKSVNRDNQKLSVLSMKHDSSLEIYSILLAGMRGSIELLKWKVEETKLTSRQFETNTTEPQFHHSLSIGTAVSYPEIEQLQINLNNFRSMVTKAKIDILGNEKLGKQVVSWIESYEAITQDWQEGVTGVNQVVNGNSMPIQAAQGTLLDVKNRVNFALTRLSTSTSEILIEMQANLTGEND